MTSTATMPKQKKKSAGKRTTSSKTDQARKANAEKRKKMRSARTADRHELYQEAVQCPEAEVAFIDRIYKKYFNRLPESLREDFCGTALLCCEWVKRRKTNRAVGVDLDPEVLQWGRDHNLANLKDHHRERLELVEENVLTARTEPVDVLVAFNFSYFLFMTRKELLDYFRAVKEHMKEESLFMLDCYGGYEAQDVVEEERPCDGFAYVWDQADFNPITHETTCHIHFEFPDKTSMKKAFSYTWRLWSLPEIRDILEEVGFGDIVIYWEGTDPETEEGDGNFKPTTKGEVCPGWVAYIVCRPN